MWRLELFVYFVCVERGLPDDSFTEFFEKRNHVLIIRLNHDISNNASLVFYVLNESKSNKALQIIDRTTIAKNNTHHIGRALATFS